MENEIELKIRLHRENVAKITAWLNELAFIAHDTETLGNTYYDTADQFFAQHKMGLRVRQKNKQYELTLKTQGEIVGGLHIRPEYNLPLNNATPDFKRLVSHYHLQMPEIGALTPVFSTDFVRQKWFIAYQNAQIEVALDQGVIQNPFGKTPICELELELKQGNLADLIAFLDQLPRYDGMWLSGLSKAQRGYLEGNVAEIAKMCEKLTACNSEKATPHAQYQHEQAVADALRLQPDNAQLAAQFTLPNEHTTLADYLISADYFSENLRIIKKLYC